MKRVGATYGKSTPHEAQAVLIGNGVSLFDFVKAGDVLCQVSDIKIESDLTIDDAKAIAKGKKKVPIHDIIAKLDILVRRSQPIMPGSPVEPATVDEILEFLLRRADTSNHIHLGDLLRRPDVEFFLGGSFLDNHLAVLGMIGTGKSNTVKVILKQVNWEGARAIVIDPHGEYEDGRVIDMGSMQVDEDLAEFKLYSVLGRLRKNITDKQERILDKVTRVVRHSLVDNLQSYIKACDEEYVHGGSTLQEPLKEAIWIEYALMRVRTKIKDSEYKEPLIFNLNGLSTDKAIQVVKGITEFVLEWGKAGNGSYLFIDEAQTFVPQKGTPDSKKPIIDLITEGRKFKCGVVLATQRPARVDKDVLSQCNSKIIHKLTNENDIKQVRASTEYSSKQMFDEVQKLRKGEALMVSSEIERPVFIKVDKYGV